MIRDIVDGIAFTLALIVVIYVGLGFAVAFG